MTSIRRLATGLALAMYFAFAPTEIPPWRLDPAARVVAELAVGEPVPTLGSRR